MCKTGVIRNPFENSVKTLWFPFLKTHEDLSFAGEIFLLWKFNLINFGKAILWLNYCKNRKPEGDCSPALFALPAPFIYFLIFLPHPNWTLLGHPFLILSCFFLTKETLDFFSWMPPFMISLRWTIGRSVTLWGGFEAERPCFFFWLLASKLESWRLSWISRPSRATVTPSLAMTLERIVRFLDANLCISAESILPSTPFLGGGSRSWEVTGGCHRWCHTRICV